MPDAGIIACGQHLVKQALSLSYTDLWKRNPSIPGWLLYSIRQTSAILLPYTDCRKINPSIPGWLIFCLLGESQGNIEVGRCKEMVGIISTSARVRLSLSLGRRKQ